MAFNPQDHMTKMGNREYLEVKWREVFDFPNYEVSNTGLVRNKQRNKLIAQNTARGGYYRVTLWRENLCYGFSVHRLVAAMFIENPEHKPQVNHIDGNKLNNSVENLEWCNQTENNLHASRVLNRPFATGEKHGMTTLSQEQVNEIRQKYSSGGYFHKDLAAEYGVSRPTITNIINAKTWGN